MNYFHFVLYTKTVSKKDRNCVSSPIDYNIGRLCKWCKIHIAVSVVCLFTFCKSLLKIL